MTEKGDMPSIQYKMRLGGPKSMLDCLPAGSSDKTLNGPNREHRFQQFLYCCVQVFVAEVT
jgi:hypothetical protein